MFIIKALPQFDAWLTQVSQEIRGRIAARLERLSLGLFGDVDKRTQKRDIQRAKLLAALLDDNDAERS